MNRPEYEVWHGQLPGNTCECDEAYSGRNLVDSHCYYHRMIEVVEILREFNWVVTPPVSAPLPTQVRWASEK